MSLYLDGKKYKIALNKEYVKFILPTSGGGQEPQGEYLKSFDNYILMSADNLYLIPKEMNNSGE